MDSPAVVALFALSLMSIVPTIISAISPIIIGGAPGRGEMA
jgi:hypothetical protein